MTTSFARILEGSGALITPLPFSNAEFQRRLDGVRAAMLERGLEAFISFTPENLYYLTAHDTPGYYFYQSCVITPDHLPVNVLRTIEAKNTLGALLDRVERGEEIVITRHGKAVARLVPNTRRVDPKQALAAFEGIRERARQLLKKRPSPFDWPALKKFRDQDRP